MKPHNWIRECFVVMLAVVESHLVDLRSADAGFFIRSEDSRRLEFYILFTFGAHTYGRGPYSINSGEQVEVDTGSFSLDRFYVVGMRDPGAPGWAHPNTFQTTHQGSWNIREPKRWFLPSGSWQLRPNQVVSDTIRSGDFRALDQFVQRPDGYHNILLISPPMAQSNELYRPGPFRAVRTRDPNYCGELLVDWNGFVRLGSW